MRRSDCAAWCSLILFVCLSAIWIALRIHVRNPMFGASVFDPGTNSLVYFDGPASFNDVSRITGATRVDLDTGRVEAISFNNTTLVTQPFGNGQRLRFRSAPTGEVIGFEVFKMPTGEPVLDKSLRGPLILPEIVGDRYLVGLGMRQGATSSFEVVDIFANEPEATIKDFPFHPSLPGAVRLIRKPLRGTSLFAVALPSLQQVSIPGRREDVVIFEIQDGQTRELARWASGCSPANMIDHDGKLYSLSADAKHVEVRETPSLLLVDTRRLPSEIAEKWSSIQFVNGLGRFDNPTTRQAEFFRLPDFERIEAPPIYRFWSHSEQPKRYGLLAYRTRNRTHYAVVDSQERKIIFQRDASLLSSAELLDDARLGICELTSIVSVDVIDLPTGKVIKRLRPYAWLDWWIPILALASVANCVLWIYAARAAGLPPGLSMLTLTVIVSGTSLFGWFGYGTAWLIERPCWGYLFVVMASMMFASAWHAALGSNHWTRRVLVLIVSLCIVLQIVAFMDVGDDRSPSFMPVLTLLTTAAPALLVAGVLWIARLMGLMWVRTGDLSSTFDKSQLGATLNDYFRLTAATGLLFMSLASLRTSDWNLDRLVVFPLLRYLALLSIIALPVAVLTVANARAIQRLMSALMVACAAYLVVDVALLFWYGPVYPDFVDLTFMRIGVAIGLCSHLFFTAWRLDGWRLRFARVMPPRGSAGSASFNPGY